MKKPIYFDYAATTPVDPRVAAKMAGYLTESGCFGNPASTSHQYGWEAEEAVDTARRQVAQLLQAKPNEIIFTSGATESNNLAIKGLFQGQSSKRHIITVETEHKAVLDTCRYLESQGADVTYLKPGRDGLLSLEAIEAAITPDTLLISIMHINNEIGVVQDIQAIGQLAKQHGVLFHVDAAQSAGKLPIDVKAQSIDLLSISAHKMYGPKGIGALFVREGLDRQLAPQMHGGAQERGVRSGTLATHQIVGLGEAASIAQAEMASESQRLTRLRDKLWAGLDHLPGIHRHGSATHVSPHHLNIGFEGLSGEMLINSLTDIAVSMGSACNSRSASPSHVLESIGVLRAVAEASIRLSIGRFTTESDVDHAIAHIADAVNALYAQRRYLWSMQTNEHTTE